MDKIVKNIKIKKLIKTYKNNNKLFFVEGIMEFKMAIKGNYIPNKILICKDIFDNYNIIKSFNSIIIFISLNIFQKLVYRKNSGGIIGIFQKLILKTIQNIIPPKNSLIVILDGIEKPGNLGAILRTADSAGVNFIICCNLQTSIFNTNVIRCSLGSVFTQQIMIEDKKLILDWLKQHNIEIVSTSTNLKSTNLYDTYFASSSSLAIVLGSENKGLSNDWLKKSNKIIKIPMFGFIDSLNVSNVFSIIIYEIIRRKKYII
ncbi:TrmH family RNA methyltransferase [Blattabacterium cuenoti]|uniref:TrmH family RNA methyltransferase n=1 Tax=Blattabacterium cuenoti TaxID=1653831 RepID=UPI00163B7027|nr:TrmH family RNA methyltransferase [Blattabacterium cuenoti]